MAVLETSSGHKFGYSRAGANGGVVALLHHGLFGDGRIPDAWSDVARTAGLELITIERPGYGATPPLAMSRVLDWSVMAVEVIDRLELPERFQVIGISAGAPYAYALAASFPERVARVGVLSGVPFTAEADVLSLYPPATRAAYAAFSNQPDEALQSYFKAVTGQFGDAFIAEHGLASALTAIAAHGHAGPAREARLQALPWGFAPAEIRAPVHLWHAEADDTVPVAAAEWSASRLPDARFQRLSGASHFPALETVKLLFDVLGRNLERR